MNKPTLLLTFLAGVLLSACGSKRTLVSEELDLRTMDTLVVTAEKPAAMKTAEEFNLDPYNAAADRTIDLIDTELDLEFDWEQEQVIGEATLTLRPYFYPTRTVTLDAKGFEFSRVALHGQTTDLPYEYDGQQIVITLPRTYTRAEELQLDLDYVATPAASGGSAAITSDKGLFFINPRGEEPDKPTQIWTQGETEHNSRWFPTVDKPNERMTQTIRLTVDQKYKTLSNGLLVDSQQLPGKRRTDTWRQDKPHAPYLVMLTIGEFEIVTDQPWRGKPVNYYLEPKYAPYAKNIFPYTREMLDFFSDQLGVEYPWDKYSQVVVRDYVSGAMENTSAVIFGEFMHGTDRDLIDVLTNEKIVAHEMYHHWFGDLVTTENWANLTLNEGFANYSEYLWLEEHHGRDEADYHRLGELQGYLQSAAGGIHPLIHYGYDDKEDMFDAHSYNKGGLVLHMLRTQLGDEAFFAGLKRYLNDNEFTAVEVDELRMAFEDVTGLDLQWFFNQWFLAAGHPELLVSHEFRADDKTVALTVEQTQNADVQPAIFQLPVEVTIHYVDGGREEHDIFIDQRRQTFELPARQRPAAVVFDSEDVILGEIAQDSDEDPQAMMHLARYGDRFVSRLNGIRPVASMEPSAERTAILNDALEDPFWVIRAIAARNVEVNAGNADPLKRMAREDPHSQTRAAAITTLAETGDATYVTTLKQVIDNEPSYNVVGEALAGLVQLDRDAALDYAKRLETTDNQNLLEALSDVYTNTEDPRFLEFFERRSGDMQGYSVINFLNNYAELAVKAQPDRIAQAVESMTTLAKDQTTSPWRRFGAMRALDTIYSNLPEPATNLREVIAARMDEIKAVETNQQLKAMYGQFPSAQP